MKPFTDAMKAYWARQQAELHRLTVAVTAPYEDRGGRPTDAKNTVETVDSAVKRLVQQDRHRSLITAIDTLHARRQSNGKPVVFIP
jgi:hypothetical protein